MQVEPVASTSKIPDNDGSAVAIEKLPMISLAQSANTRRPVVFTPDAKLCFVTAGPSVKIYNAATCQLLSTLRPEEETDVPEDRPVLREDTVTSVVLDPTNPLRLIVASLDGYVRIWDYLEGKVMRVLDVARPIVAVAAHAADPGYLYVATKEEGRIQRALDVKRELKGDFPAIKDKVPQCCINRISLRKNSKPPKSGLKRLLATTHHVFSIQFSPDGTILIVAAPTKLYLLSLSDLESGWVTIKPTEPITTLAVHPNDHSIATGNIQGKIHFYYCLIPEWWAKRSAAQKATGEKEFRRGPRPAAMMHWHAHPVGALQFTSNGAYLLSGGREAVLVNWQLRSSGQKDFLPRLGAPVVGISLSAPSSERGQEIAVSLSDGTILFIASQNMAVKRSIAGLKWDMSSSRKTYHLPLAVQPETGNLVLPSSHPSAIQFYSQSTDSHLLELEVSPTNRIADRQGDEVRLEPVRVERVAFSPSGEWMATYDTWKSFGFTSESSLKFWHKGDEPLDFSLVTRIDDAHRFPVTAFAFSPAEDNKPVLLTTDINGTVKTWTVARSKAVKGHAQVHWRCQQSTQYRRRSAYSAAWSPDGSLYAIAHGASISLWSSETQKLVHTFVGTSARMLQLVKFGGKSGDILIAGGKQGVVAWSLLDFQPLLNNQSHITAMLEEVDSNKLQIVESTTHRLATKAGYVSRLATIDLESTKSTILQELPVAYRQVDTLHNKQSKQSSLLLISRKGDLLVTDVNKPSAVASKIAIPSTRQSRLFDDIFGSSLAPQPKSSNTVIPASTTSKTESPYSSILAPAAHVLPPVSLLWRDLLALPALLPIKKEETAVEEVEETSKEDVEMDSKVTATVQPTPVGLIASLFKKEDVVMQ